MKIMTRLFLIGALFLFFGCAQDEVIEEKSHYPACFDGLTSSHTGGGCGIISLITRLDTNKLVSIYLNEKELDIKTWCKTYDIADFPADITIDYYTHANHPDSMYFNFCSDIVYPAEYFGTITTWKAVSGTVMVAVSRDNLYRDDCEGFQASLKLDNIKFIKENSTQDTLVTQLVIRDAALYACIP